MRVPWLSSVRDVVLVAVVGSGGAWDSVRWSRPGAVVGCVPPAGPHSRSVSDLVSVPSLR